MPFSKTVEMQDDDDDAVPDNIQERNEDDSGSDGDIVANGTNGKRKAHDRDRASSGNLHDLGEPINSRNEGVPIETVISHLEHRTQSAQLYMDFLMYIPFLILFIFFSGRDISTNYYVVRVVKDRLMGNEIPTEQIDKRYPDLANAHDWGKWASYVMVPNLWNCKFPGEGFERLDVQGGNMLIGAMRIRTHRVKRDSCGVNDELLPPGHQCYAQWDTDNEERSLRYYFPNPVDYPDLHLVHADMDSFEYEVLYPVEPLSQIASISLFSANGTIIPSHLYTIQYTNVSSTAPNVPFYPASHALLSTIGFRELRIDLLTPLNVSSYTMTSMSNTNLRTMEQWEASSRIGVNEFVPRQSVSLTSIAEWPMGGEFSCVLSEGASLVVNGTVTATYPEISTLKIRMLRQASEVIADTATTPFLYRYEGCGRGGDIRGDIETYDCGGYTIDVPFRSSCNSVTALTQALQSNNYPFYDNSATRFISIELFIYTFATDSFTSVKLYNEVASGGSWVNKWQIRTFQVFDNSARRWCLDIFFLAFVIYFIFRFFSDWRAYTKGYTPGSYHTRGKPWGYILSFWNILEIANLICFLVVFVVEFLWIGESATDPVTFPVDDTYPDRLESVLQLYMIKVSSNSINTIITFIKFLKYVRLNSRLNVLSATISCKAGDLMAVVIVFAYVAFAYALAANALFGTTLYDYRSLGEAFSTLMRMLLGDFDFESLREESKYLAAIFFWSFVVLGLFLLLNFLVAILSEGFAQVSGNISMTPMEEQLTQIWAGLKRALRPSRVWAGLKLVVQGNSRHSVLVRSTSKIQDYRCVMEELSNEHAAEGNGVASGDSRSMIYNAELPAFIGEEEYALLGQEYMDDVWDDILYDWNREQQNDQNRVTMQNTDYVEEAVRASVKGGLEDVDQMWHKMLQLQEELNNLSSVLHGAIRPGW